ncbi:lysylphosphatidylglycerol synthase transmembrane domain-containing protein [soil metagenome]
MRKKTALVLQYIFFLGGGIFLIWWQFHNMTPEQMAKFKYALAGANYRILIPVIIFALASHISRSLRWKILLEPLGYTPSLFNTFSVTMVGYLANSFVPRLGEILKCTMLGKYEKIPVQKLIGTIVIERIFDFLCYLVFILFTVLIQYKLVGGFVKQEISEMVSSNSGIPLWLKAVIAIAIIISAFILLRFLFKKFAPATLLRRINNFIQGLREGIASIQKLKKRRLFLMHTLFIWMMYLLQIYLGFSALKDVSHLGLDAACAVLTLATLAMIVTPGGIGTFPAAVFLVLNLYNIDHSTGEAFGWLMWGTTTFIVLFFGLICLGALFFTHRKKQAGSTTTSSATIV